MLRTAVHSKHYNWYRIVLFITIAFILAACNYETPGKDKHPTMQAFPKLTKGEITIDSLFSDVMELYYDKGCYFIAHLNQDWEMNPCRISIYVLWKDNKTIKKITDCADISYVVDPSHTIYFSERDGKACYKVPYPWDNKYEIPIIKMPSQEDVAAMLHIDKGLIYQEWERIDKERRRLIEGIYNKYNRIDSIYALVSGGIAFANKDRYFINTLNDEERNKEFFPDVYKRSESYLSVLGDDGICLKEFDRVTLNNRFSWDYSFLFIPVLFEHYGWDYYQYTEGKHITKFKCDNTKYGRLLQVGDTLHKDEIHHLLISKPLGKRNQMFTLYRINL